MVTYIGIDNGTSGSIAILTKGNYALFAPTPIKREQSYTRAKKLISRVNYDALIFSLSAYAGAMVIIERPMVNPKRFEATLSAVRALESTLIAIETLGMAYQYIDSRKWQSALLPKGVAGPELKSASVDIGCRLFPHLEEAIRHHGDADSLLIAEYARKEQL